jgi:hypothetical protein
MIVTKMIFNQANEQYTKMASKYPPVPVHQTVVLTDDELDAVSSLSTAMFGDGAGGFFSKPQPRKDAAAADSLDVGYVPSAPTVTFLETLNISKRCVWRLADILLLRFCCCQLSTRSLIHNADHAVRSEPLHHRAPGTCE